MSHFSVRYRGIPSRQGVGPFEAPGMGSAKKSDWGILVDVEVS
jgi:hypothetical protein